MNIETFTEERKVATEKWHEYKSAEKQSGNPLYKDLRKVYNQIKAGKKMIDIFKVIQTGGVHENFHPKLAIAKAKGKTIRCYYGTTGNVSFLNTKKRGWWYEEYADDVILKNCLPHLPQGTIRLELDAPVPIIPPKYLPKILTDDYYVLWEVDVWKKIPPTDPWLLRRITKTMFVVLAGWDLTELEKSVMVGRMY